jgi:hypothetical protein
VNPRALTREQRNTVIHALRCLHDYCEERLAENDKGLKAGEEELLDAPYCRQERQRARQVLNLIIHNEIVVGEEIDE